METDTSVEEMLFDFSSSEILLDSIWSYESEDEFLEPQFQGFLQEPATGWAEKEPTAATSDAARLLDSTGGEDGLGPVVPDRTWVIARIEDIFTSLVDGVSNSTEPLIITLKTRSNITRRNIDLTENANGVPPPKTQTISFPGSNAQEAWRFTVIVRILELIHSGLVDGTLMTKRDLYYRHPDLFVKQSVVDRYVDDLACTFGVPRALLNLTAAAKGLVAGNFVIHHTDGTSVYGLGEDEGLLVPKVSSDDVLDLSSVFWILVIEKEATFRSLLSSSHWKHLGRNGLALTAKGYPDLASRKFLRHLADASPSIPMYALMDFDPDGIAILSTYKHGSFRLAHEDGAYHNAPGLNLPDLQWLGVQSHHISRHPVNEGDTETAGSADGQGLTRLTARDRRRAHALLEWDVCAEGGSEPLWRDELQRMLMLNVKVEMQILDEVAGGLVLWLGAALGGVHGARPAVSSGDSDDELLF